MLTFLAADLISGEVQAELPLAVAGDTTRLLMEVGGGDFELPVRDPACPPDWDVYTRPWRTMIAAVNERGRIVWSGIIRDRFRNPLEPVVSLPCVTVEGYLDRRFVPTLSYSGADQTSGIARGLAGIAGDAWGIDLVLDTPASGVTRDRSYYKDESATVLQRLQELAQVINGFEWTIEVEWADASQTRLQKRFVTGYPHLGRVVARPDPVFELPGSVVSADYEERWGADDAATYVIATGDGEGDAKTMSAPVIDHEREAAGWPRLEARRSFSSVTEQSTIDAHAAAVADELFGGQEVVTLTVRTDRPPYFGEWSLGDAVGLRIDTDTLHVDTVLRVVGWYLRDADGTVEPVVARMDLTGGDDT